MQQIATFNRDGYLTLENAVQADTLQQLHDEFKQWEEDRRAHSTCYGETHDKRPRFDIGAGHCPEKPALRQIASPVEISATYPGFMRDNIALYAIAQLIGPNPKFNNSKINAKQPGAATEVKYHQDFLFGPHTNYGIIAALSHYRPIIFQVFIWARLYAAGRAGRCAAAIMKWHFRECLKVPHLYTQQSKA